MHMFDAFTAPKLRTARFMCVQTSPPTIKALLLRHPSLEDLNMGYNFITDGDGPNDCSISQTTRMADLTSLTLSANKSGALIINAPLLKVLHIVGDTLHFSVPLILSCATITKLRLDRFQPDLFPLMPSLEELEFTLNDKSLTPITVLSCPDPAGVWACPCLHLLKVNFTKAASQSQFDHIKDVVLARQESQGVQPLKALIFSFVDRLHRRRWAVDLMDYIGLSQDMEACLRAHVSKFRITYVPR